MQIPQHEVLTEYPVMCRPPSQGKLIETQNHMGFPPAPRAEFMAFYGIFFFTCKLRSDSEELHLSLFFLAKVNDFLEKIEIQIV